MLIEITTNGIEMKQQERDEVKDQVKDSLTRFQERITRIGVHLEDINGPKEGVDTKCTLELRPKGLDPVATSGTAASPGLALESALSKAVSLLDRRFGRLAEARR